MIWDCQNHGWFYRIDLNMECSVLSGRSLLLLSIRSCVCCVLIKLVPKFCTLSTACQMPVSSVQYSVQYSVQVLRFWINQSNKKSDSPFHGTTLDGHWRTNCAICIPSFWLKYRIYSTSFKVVLYCIVMLYCTMFNPCLHAQSRWRGWMCIVYLYRYPICYNFLDENDF